MNKDQSFLKTEAGFLDGGRFYCLRDPRQVPAADSDLWNEQFQLKATLTGDVTGRYLEPNPMAYSGTERAVYIRDEETAACWGAPQEVYDLPDGDFAFVAGSNQVVWETLKNGIQMRRTLRVPSEDPVEHWTISLQNTGPNGRHLSVFPVFSLGFLGLLDHRVRYEEDSQGIVSRYFRYYVKIEDYYPLSRQRNTTYCLASERPDAWDCSREVFAGTAGLGAPAALRGSKLSGSEAHYEESLAAFQYTITLAPGECREWRFILGPAHCGDALAPLREKYLSDGAEERIDAVWCELEAQHAGCFKIETPEKDFDSYVNHWQPRRTWMIGKTLRFHPSPQGRNAIQDAMGAAMINQDLSRQWFSRIWRHQQTDGFLPHGMPMVEGAEVMPITKIPHKDTNSWGPDALAFYIRETGDIEILNEIVPYADSDQTATLYEHVCHGLQWLLDDRTARGLSRIGQGDWNDPLNMVGPEQRGESIWLTEALAYALDTWADVAARTGDAATQQKYLAEAEACRAALREHAWDGRWFCRAYTDAGRKLGGGDQLFLNAQSWALISGCADEAQCASIIDSVNAMLATSEGPMVVAPAFDGMVEDVGKLTLKTPGTGENGSVYCHAVTFWAYALFLRGYSEEAWSALRAILPRDEAAALTRVNQLPIYIPNFYRGTPCLGTAGRSSRSPNTGTAAWYYRTVLEGLFGIRAGWDGLTCQPQLPSAWAEASITRHWRGAAYRFEFKRDPGVRELLIQGPDGKEVSNPIAPIEPGQMAVFQVKLPADQ